MFKDIVWWKREKRKEKREKREETADDNFLALKFSENQLRVPLPCE